jgi:hypothetical protein
MGFLLDTFLLFCLQALGVCTQASVEIGYHCLKFGYVTLTHSKLHALMQRYFRISHSSETSEFEVYLCQCVPAIDRNHWQLHLGSRSEWSTIHISSITLELSLSTTFFSQFPSHGTSLGGVQVVLELCSDGTVVTSDQPPTVLGSLPSDFLQQNAQYLKPGDLLRFAIGDQGISIMDGKPMVADIHFQGLASKNRAGGADSCTKILFQYAARHSPLTITDLLVAIEASDDDGDTSMAC